jgi:hypothetical protein
MKTKFYPFLTALLLIYAAVNAQYVREYNPGTKTNLSFNCIAKAKSGNYFIAGLHNVGKDTSVYVAEVTAAGTVVREKLVELNIANSKAYMLNAMIVDADGNIVIAGSINPVGLPSKAFLMKLSPALSILLHTSYNNSKVSEPMVFTDVKEYFTTGTNSVNNAYYVSGYNVGTATGPDAALMRLDRSTGAPLTVYNGQPTTSSTNDTYDALWLDTTGNAASPPSIYVTGRLSSGGTSTFRPWLTRHNISTLAFTKGQRYLSPLTQTARLYNSGIVKDVPKNNMLYCWYGSLSTVGYPKALGLTSVNASTLLPVFQKQYGLSPALQNFIILSKVETDPNGYVTHGQWWDSVSTQGEIFLLRVDKSGVPQWCRQYKNVLNDVTPHNAGFIIDGPSIFAIGYKIVSGYRRGVLIKTDVATGAMDTACAKVLAVKYDDFTYTVADSLKKIDLSVAVKNNYYAVNCLATDSLKPCDSCIGKPLPCASGFTLTSQLVSNNTLFTLTASNFSTLCNSRFVVSQVTPASPFPDVAGTLLTVPAWGTTTPTLFPGYAGTGTAGTNTTGTFVAGLLYRVRHIVSGYNNCGVFKYDTTSQLVFQAAGFKPGSPMKMVIIPEGMGKINLSGYRLAASSNNQVDVIKQPGDGGALIYPNPANTSVAFSTAGLKGGNILLTIVDATGHTLSTVDIKGKYLLTVNTTRFAGGLYLYRFTSNGKLVASGKFMVQH